MTMNKKWPFCVLQLLRDASHSRIYMKYTEKKVNKPVIQMKHHTLQNMLMFKKWSPQPHLVKLLIRTMTLLGLVKIRFLSL